MSHPCALRQLPLLLVGTRHGGATGLARLRWTEVLPVWLSASATRQTARCHPVCGRHDVPGGCRRRQAQGGGRPQR